MSAAPFTPTAGALAWSLASRGVVQVAAFGADPSGKTDSTVAFQRLVDSMPAPQRRRLRRHTAEPLAVGLVVENGSCRFRGAFYGGDRDLTPSPRRSFDRLASWARPR